MILITWRLMPAELHLLWNRETWESQINFTDYTLSRNRSSSLWTPDAPNRRHGSRAAPSQYLFHRLHFV